MDLENISKPDKNTFQTNNTYSSPRKTDKESARSYFSNKKYQLYKTEICRSHSEVGYCKYGPNCQFAHDVSELRKVSRHPKYKTETCKTFWKEGSCPYGRRCCFIHINGTKEEEIKFDAYIKNQTYDFTESQSTENKTKIDRIAGTENITDIIKQKNLQSPSFESSCVIKCINGTDSSSSLFENHGESFHNVINESSETAKNGNVFYNENYKTTNDLVDNIGLDKNQQKNGRFKFENISNISKDTFKHERLISKHRNYSENFKTHNSVFENCLKRTHIEGRDTADFYDKSISLSCIKNVFEESVKVEEPLKFKNIIREISNLSNITKKSFIQNNLHLNQNLSNLIASKRSTVPQSSIAWDIHVFNKIEVTDITEYSSCNLQKRNDCSDNESFNIFSFDLNDKQAKQNIDKFKKALSRRNEECCQCCEEDNTNMFRYCSNILNEKSIEENNKKDSSLRFKYDSESRTNNEFECNNSYNDFWGTSEHLA